MEWKWNETQLQLMCVTGSYSTMYSYRGHVYYILSRKTATKVMRPRSDQGSMYCTRLA